MNCLAVPRPSDRSPHRKVLFGRDGVLILLLQAALMAGESRVVVLAPSWHMLDILFETVEVHPEIREVIEGSFSREPPAIHGSGYVVRSLEAALWAFVRSDSFETAVSAAVNLGDVLTPRMLCWTGRATGIPSPNPGLCT